MSVFSYESHIVRKERIVEGSLQYCVTLLIEMLQFPIHNNRNRSIVTTNRCHKINMPQCTLHTVCQCISTCLEGQCDRIVHTLTYAVSSKYETFALNTTATPLQKHSKYLISAIAPLERWNLYNVSVFLPLLIHNHSRSPPESIEIIHYSPKLMMISASNWKKNQTLKREKCFIKHSPSISVITTVVIVLLALNVRWKVNRHICRYFSHVSTLLTCTLVSYCIKVVMKDKTDNYQNRPLTYL